LIKYLPFIALFSWGLENGPVNFIFSHVCILIFLISQLKDLRIPKLGSLMLAYLIFTTTNGIIWNAFRGLSQFIGLTMYFVAGYTVWKMHESRSIFLLKNIVLFVLLVGYIKWFAIFFDMELSLFAEKIHYSSLGLPRFDSVFNEPSHYVYSVGPAFFLFSFKNKNERKWKTLILISLFLTLSSTFFISFAITVTIYLFKGFNPLRILGALALFGSILVFFPDVNSRLSSLYSLFEGMEITNQSNASSVALYSHLYSYLQLWKNEPWKAIFGTGIGAYSQVFVDYGGVLLKGTIWGEKMLNVHDANSLLIRTLSEFGIGFILVLLAFFRRIRSFINSEPELFLFMFFLLISKLIRDGNYFIGGLPFYLGYIYAKRSFSSVEKG
jgi:hypothetical protein